MSRILPVAGALFLSFALACSSSSSQPTTSTPPPAAEDPQATADAKAALLPAIDALVDLRFEATAEDRAGVVATFNTSKVTFPELDALVRGGRAAYPKASPALLGKITKQTLTTYFTDYTGAYYLYVPEGYDPGQAYPLVFVAHGGNSAMPVATAESTAHDYIGAYWPALGKDFKAIVVAPATTVGWGGVGNVILFDTISKLSRQFHIDAEKVYVTGQSMGGHMSYRTALNFGDRFAAFSPQSGGYDYASTEKGDVIPNLFTTSAYVTYGTAAKGELYGIGDDNKKNKTWLDAHRYDWTMVEKDGGHEIYADEQPKVAAFFASHPRQTYRKRTYYKGGGGMAFTAEQLDTWDRGYKAVPGRVLRWNARHWLEVTPRPGAKDAMVFYGDVGEGNRITIESTGVRNLRVYVHPSMGLDLAQPITVVVNGETLSSAVVTPSIETFLDQLRDFDDRGRLFWGAIDVAVTTDHAVPEPSN